MESFDPTTTPIRSIASLPSSRDGSRSRRESPIPLWNKGIWVVATIERVYDSGVLEDLKAAIAGLDPELLADPEAIKELYACTARMEAKVAKATAAFDASGLWQGEGCRSAASWLAWRCRVPSATARRRVRVGRALRQLPVAEEAWLEGRITEHHVACLAGARTPANADDMARDEAVLVAEAERLSFAGFIKVLAYWRWRADADEVEKESKRERDERRLHLSKTFGGCYAGEVWLDPINGAIVAAEIERISDEFFAQDWAEAEERLGAGNVSVSKLRRTAAQRRADALVEMASRSTTAPADGRRPEPLFTVLVGYETFAGPICELADGTVVTPGSLVDWLSEAWVERVVFDSPSRVIDVGVTRRIFAGATRRAVEVRDGTCFHPSCEEPAGRCQIDHVQPWSVGGPTTQDNGRPACGFHNRRRHRHWRQRPPARE